MASKRERSKWRLIPDFISAAWDIVRMPGKSYRGPLPPADERLLEIAADLRHHVTRLADEIGERNIRFRPRELAQSADYIAAEMANAGYTVECQEYEVDGTNCANLEVELSGLARSEEVVIVGVRPSLPGAGRKSDGHVEPGNDWLLQWYLKVIAKKAGQAIHVLDRFHIMQKMNNV